MKVNSVRTDQVTAYAEKVTIDVIRLRLCQATKSVADTTLMIPGQYRLEHRRVYEVKNGH